MTRCRRAAGAGNLNCAGLRIYQRRCAGHGNTMPTGNITGPGSVDCDAASARR